jgi:hypothetical protein
MCKEIMCKEIHAANYTALTKKQANRTETTCKRRTGKDRTRSASNIEKPGTKERREEKRETRGEQDKGKEGDWGGQRDEAENRQLPNTTSRAQESEKRVRAPSAQVSNRCDRFLRCPFEARRRGGGKPIP